ncbi:hypothetical protein LTR37_009862 [Vermiconidia calcicola]|uniref:Uncharacterized protein n=1 Tax=Vermiconidia calcicola TaxID=1690605 RepID=A0ACC3N706_9PEZI|nr:hypothetical protein LTR37_009862 [Vermiconidia calcicola]
MLLFALLALSLKYCVANLTYKGVDWSSTLVEESGGQTYIGLDGKEKPPERVFRNNGVNIIRQCIWNTDGDYGLEYNLQLAQRAQAQGLKIYLDFHMSSTWADPSHQDTPAEWQDYGIDELAAAVQSYTRSTMNSFQDAGVSLEMVSIGNEITMGLLWPVGHMDVSSYNVATLLRAASAGIKGSNMDPTPRIMIHLDNGWNWDTQQWWYDTVLEQGPLASSDFDIQGVSYYPFYNEDATITSLTSSLTNMIARYGKEVMLVETDWPADCPDPLYEFPSDTQDIAISVAGQAEWISDVAGAVEAAGGTGLFYWEPAWIGNAGLGSSCANNLMFDRSGQAEDSVKAFRSI